MLLALILRPTVLGSLSYHQAKKKWTLTKLGYKYIDGSSNYSLIESPENYVNKLAQLITASKIKTKSAAVSIPVSSAIIKVVQLPLKTDEDLKGAVASDRYGKTRFSWLIILKTTLFFGRS